MKKNITDKDYELPARFTDIVVLRETPLSPQPKWRQEILDKIHATDDINEKNTLYQELFGPPSETLKRTLELLKDVA